MALPRVVRAVVVGVAVAAVIAVAPGLVAAQTVEEPMGPVVVLAHRGASHDAPEHTFPAYDLAIEYDTDFLECDLQLTKDDVLVCIHDTDVTRTTGGAHTGRVDSYTLEELRAMDFGSWFNTANPTRARPEYVGAPVVPFEEQLDCYLGHNPRMRFHVETKAPAEYDGKMEPLLVDLLTRKQLLPAGDADPQTSPVIVQSFERDSLVAVKALAPSLPTAYLWTFPPADVLEGAMPEGVDVAAPVHQALLADPTFVARAHAHGHEVHTWTVDDPTTIDRLLDLGVDGIFTNRPDVLRERVDARGTGVAAAERGNPVEVPDGCPGVAGTVRATATPVDPPPGPEAAPGAPVAPPGGALPATGGPTPLVVSLAVVALVLAGRLLVGRRPAHDMANAGSNRR